MALHNLILKFVACIINWMRVYPILIAAALAISGCTIPGTNIDIPIPGIGGDQYEVFENDIVVIRTLQAIPSEIAPGQSTKIIANIENQIDQKIDSIDVELYDYCEGLFTIDRDKTQTITNLLGRETRQVSWVLTANDDINLATTCPRDGVKVRVTFPYQTVSSTTIAFMQEQEIQRRREANDYRKTDSIITLGEGPVKPILRIKDEQPVSSGSKKTVISFQIENKGAGFVKDSAIDVNGLHFKSKTFQELGDALEACKNDLDLGDSPKDPTYGKIRLIQKKSSEFPCTMDIPAGAIDRTEISDVIFATLDYQYEFRKSTQVTVRPKL